MQPTYFASFLLGERPEIPAPAVADVLEHVANWIFKNPRRTLTRPSNWPEIPEPLRFPTGEKIQLLGWKDPEKKIDVSAVRFEHSDEQSRFWRTDCVIASTSDPAPEVRFTVTVAAGGASERLYAYRPPSSRPRIVYTVMDKFGGREAFPLKSKFFRIKESEAMPFAGFLLNPQRTMPVVFVSRNNQDGLYCNPAELANKLVGIAYVCVAESKRLSVNLADHIDRRLNAFDGSIRVYWPRMTAEDPPYRHRFWTERQLEGRNIADELLRLIGTTSITRHVPGLVRWEDIEREHTRRTIHLLQQSSGETSSKISEEWLRQYDTDLASLESARQEVATLGDLLLQRDEEVRLWKRLYLSAQRSTTDQTDEEFADAPAFEDSEGALATAIHDFSTRLHVLDGRVAKEFSQFEQPELLYAALKWLCNVYWNARAGVESCADFDKSCRESCQFRYSAHQSEVTMGRYAADYEVSFGGKAVKLKEHIGYGTSTEPRHTIRIAFFFDEETKKIIVGYIGQHQPTRNSN